jgi:MFS family permease
MNKHGLAVIIGGSCTIFTGFAIRSSYGVVLPKLLPSLGISKTEAGVIYGLFFMAYTVFSPLLGLLGDRTNICQFYETIFRSKVRYWMASERWEG